MNEQTTGRASFGLDMEQMVTEAWRIFVDRPLTLLGVALLIVGVGIISHLFVVAAFFWIPFTLCIPFATVQIRAEEKSDRIFLGWIPFYPRLLAVFMPSYLFFLFLVTFSVGESFAFHPHGRAFSLTCVLLGIIGEYMSGLAGLLAVRKNLSASQALRELFADRKTTLEVFLLGGTLAVFGISGILVCCVGIVATTAFSWVCLGIAYHQMFEE